MHYKKVVPTILFLCYSVFGMTQIIDDSTETMDVKITNLTVQETIPDSVAFIKNQSVVVVPYDTLLKYVGSGYLNGTAGYVAMFHDEHNVKSSGVFYDTTTGYSFFPAYIIWDTTINIGGIIKEGSAKSLLISVGGTADPDSGAWAQFFGENHANTGNVHMQTGYNGRFKYFTQLSHNYIWDEGTGDNYLSVTPQPGGGTYIIDHDASGTFFICSNNGGGVNGIELWEDTIKIHGVLISPLTVVDSARAAWKADSAGKADSARACYISDTSLADWPISQVTGLEDSLSAHADSLANHASALNHGVTQYYVPYSDGGTAWGTSGLRYNPSYETFAVGDAPLSNVQLYLKYNPPDLQAKGIYAFLQPEITSSGTYGGAGLSFYAYSNLANAGVTDAGTYYGVYGRALHTTAGTVGGAVGSDIRYGTGQCGSDAANISSSVFGTILRPYREGTGTIAQHTDIYIVDTVGGATVTADSCIVSHHDAPSYLAGELTTGKTLGYKNVFLSSPVYNYSDGVLVTTNIDTTVGGMFTLQIESQIYQAVYSATDSIPTVVRVQGYLRTSNGLWRGYSGITYGHIDTVHLFKRGGYVCFWHKPVASSCTFQYKLTVGATETPAVTLTNTTCPVDTTRPVVIACKKIWNDYNSNGTPGYVLRYGSDGLPEPSIMSDNGTTVAAAGQIRANYSGGYGAGSFYSHDANDVIGLTIDNNTQTWDFINIVSATPDYFAIRDYTHATLPFMIEASGSNDGAFVIGTDGTINLGTVANAGADVDKFLVRDGSGNIDYRTGVELLSDIGGAPAAHGVTASYIPYASSATAFNETNIYCDYSNNRIGIDKTDPAVLLDVDGQARLGSDANLDSDAGVTINGALAICAAGTQDLKTQCEIDAHMFYLNANLYYSGGWHLYDDNLASASIRMGCNDVSSFIDFYTVKANSTPAFAMRIDDSREVGLGTSDPESKLHIYDGSAGSIAPPSNTLLTLENNGNVGLSFLSPNTTTQTITFGDPDNNDTGYISYNHAQDILFVRGRTLVLYADTTEITGYVKANFYSNLVCTLKTGSDAVIDADYCSVRIFGNLITIDFPDLTGTISGSEAKIYIGSTTYQLPAPLNQGTTGYCKYMAIPIVNGGNQALGIAYMQNSGGRVIGLQQSDGTGLSNGTGGVLATNITYMGLP